MLVFSLCGVRQNLNVFSLYRNPDLDDRISDCLPASMAAVQAEDIRAFFLFLGYLNAIIRSGWVLLPRTVMELQPSISQLSPVAISWVSAQPMHDGGTLDLLMTDVPTRVRVAVVPPTGNSDHSSLLAIISMAQAVPTLHVSRKVILNHQITNCNNVFAAIRDLPWRNI